MSSGPVTPHLSDEDLLLDFYNEATPSERARVQRHLEECAECRETDRELRAVLQAVETTPLIEPPNDFERQMWSRIEPLLPVERPWWHRVLTPRGLTPALDGSGGITGSRRLKRALYVGLATAAGLVLLTAAFSAGRLWERPAVERAEAPVVDDRARVERLLRSEVEDHLERSQRMLVELVNTSTTRGTFDTDRARAADLVAAGRLYRRSAEEVGDADVSGVLEDLERVLVEIANSSPRDEVQELGRVRQRIDDQDLLFRLRVVSREMQQNQRAAGGVVVTSGR